MEVPNDIYVVGNGPSAMDGFDNELLRERVTIAVNRAIWRVPEPDYFLTADSTFVIKSIRAKFWETKATKVIVIHEGHRNYELIKEHIHLWDRHIKPTRFNGNIGLTENDFCTGLNSGFCAMQFAILLNAKRIHLIGIDLHKYNYLPESSIIRQSVHTKLDRFYRHFVRGISILTKNDIEVISHSPISRLNEHIRFEELKYE